MKKERKKKRTAHLDLAELRDIQESFHKSLLIQSKDNVIQVPPEDEVRKRQGIKPEEPPLFILPEQSSCYLTEWEFEEAIEREIRENSYALGVSDARSSTARKAGRAPRLQVESKHSKWQKEADAIWKRRSKKSKIDVARMIAGKTGDNVNTIRQIIRHAGKAC